MTGTWMLQEEESDGNESAVCLMHNYQRMSMLSHKQRDDVVLNKLILMREISFKCAKI